MKLLRKHKAKASFAISGRCPRCNSSAPLLPACSVCDGADFLKASKAQKEVWWIRFKDLEYQSRGWITNRMPFNLTERERKHLVEVHKFNPDYHNGYWKGFREAWGVAAIVIVVLLLATL